MKRPKKFDCVQMKWDIQAKLEKELAGLSEEERQKAIEDRISRDPRMYALWKKAKSNSNQPA